MGGEESNQDAFSEAAPLAFQRWASTVFAAPRRPQDLITGVQSRDEVIERLVTQVIHREVREMRTPTKERRSTASRLGRSTVDPFGFSAETLRVESQYIAQCGACAASGLMACEACHGSCTAVCRNCSGSGKQRSEKTNRPINCKVCKKSGRVPCGACTATGRIPCRACFGSGHHLAWLTFDESEHWLVSLSPEQSPVVLAHEALSQARPLSHDELSAFAVVEEQRSQGAIETRDLDEPYRQLPRAQRAVIEPRLERIKSQQYLRLAIVRRDVTYEMCGTRGTVALSGKSLVGATTTDATRPIKRRLHAWVALVGFAVVVGVLLRTVFVGSSSYFHDAKLWSGVLIAAAAACAVPAFGTLLRAWRGGARFREVSRPTLAMAGGVVLALIGVAVIGLVVRPSPTEVQAALSSGDVVQARVALEALKEHTTGGDVLDLEDRIMLVEAGKQLGQDRLKLLDRVANRKGAASVGAATAARNERLSQIRGLVNRKDARTALAALGEWFPDDKSIEVSEERARAHEVNGATCRTDPCRLVAAVHANTARETNDRSAQVKSFRAKAWDALAVEQVREKSAAPRLRQIRQLAERASDTLDSVANDAEMRGRAIAANKFAQTEREKVPLLGTDLAVATALLGPAGATKTNVPMFSLDGVTAYAAFNKAGTCTGLFAVGSSSSNRAMKSATWPAQRILSQALGRPATIRPPNGLTSQWYDGGVPVIVRWRNGEIMELRIGDAMP